MNEITEKHYALIQPYLPVQRGNVRVSNLMVINAILFVAENGCKWRALPPRFGKWHTVYTRMRRWADAGVLDRLFDALAGDLVLTVVRHVIDELQINLDELHNDSTTVSFFGAYSESEEERRVRGRRTLAITFGHSKDRRPDQKHLLYILTVSEDGGIWPSPFKLIQSS